MKNIGIRVDGGFGIGFGHIMRCLALANELKKNGYNVFFLSKLDKGIAQVKEYGFSIFKLTANFSSIFKIEDNKRRNLEKEADEIISIIQKNNIETLLVDSYNVNQKYFRKLKTKIKKLIYIDDLNRCTYSVDILINGNMIANYMDYSEYSNDTILLLGPKYTILREEFRNLTKRDINKKVKEIMITTGGTDPYNLSTKILTILFSDEKLKKLKINVIIGKGFIPKDEIKDFCQYSNVIFHQNVKLMSKIMKKSDIAISSGGSTLYELCVCGTPTLAFMMADNQKFLVKKMDELGYIKNLGWFENLTSKIIINSVKSMINDYDYRLDVSERQQKLVDAKGVKRIVNCLKQF